MDIPTYITALCYVLCAMCTCVVWYMQYIIVETTSWVLYISILMTRNPIEPSPELALRSNTCSPIYWCMCCVYIHRVHSLYTICANSVLHVSTRYSYQSKASHVYTVNNCPLICTFDGRASWWTCTLSSTCIALMTVVQYYTASQWEKNELEWKKTFW